MSRNQYTKTLLQELASLNTIIDQKIVAGKRYAAESRKHKMLLRKIREGKSSSFGRLIPSLFRFS